MSIRVLFFNQVLLQVVKYYNFFKILHDFLIYVAQNPSEVKCRYIPTIDRVLFSDGESLGVRSDYNGVLLLDSILQKSINDGKEEVILELPLSEVALESLINSKYIVLILGHYFEAKFDNGQ